MSAADKNEVEGFDLKVTHRDDRSGQVTHKNPYRLRVVGGKGGNRMKLWERPVGSGNLWNLQGKPVGRWIEEEKEGGEVVMKYDPKAEHVSYEMPMTADQKLAQQANSVAAENETLRAELAAMKAEAEKKAAPAMEKPKAKKAVQKSKGKGA